MNTGRTTLFATSLQTAGSSDANLVFAGRTKESRLGVTRPEQMTFRCPNPECGQLSHDSARASLSVLLCDRCGQEVERSQLVPGDDGIYGVKPEPPTEGWEGHFIAVYPDGGKSGFDLNGHVLRPGAQLPGTGFVLERWDVTDEPVEEGRFGIVGILQESDR